MFVGKTVEKKRLLKIWAETKYVGQNKLANGTEFGRHATKCDISVLQRKIRKCLSEVQRQKHFLAEVKKYLQ